MPSRQRTSDPTAEILRTMTPDDLRTRLAWFQARDPAAYADLIPWLRQLAADMAAPKDDAAAESWGTLRRVAPGLFDSIAAVAPELAD